MGHEALNGDALSSQFNLKVSGIGKDAIFQTFTLTRGEQFVAIKELVRFIKLKKGDPNCDKEKYSQLFNGRIEKLQKLGVDLAWINLDEGVNSNFATLEALSVAFVSLNTARSLGITFTMPPLPKDEGLGHEVGSTFPKLDLSGLKENAGRKRQKEDIAVFSHEDASKLDENFGAPNSISLEDISASDLLQLGRGDSYYWHGGALKEIAKVLGIDIPPQGNTFFFDRSNKKKIERILRGVCHLANCKELTIPLAINRGQGLDDNKYTIDYISFSEEKGLIIDKIEKFSEDSLKGLMFTCIGIHEG